MGVAPALGPEWADLVFHVLAHARGTGSLPSTLHDPAYVAFCARHIGPASQRALESDVATLERLLTTHASLSRTQWVAWLFADVRAARAVNARDLADLGANDVRVPDALRGLGGAWVEAELLRAAAELEAPAYARLPPTTLDPAVGERILATQVAAPRLASLQVELVRALCRHGRVVAPYLLVGVPSDELGVTADHVAVQAAHEATVVEVADGAGKTLGERDVEYAALLVLTERARRTGFEAVHRDWWTSLGGMTPEALRSAVSPAVLFAVTTILDGE